ncbi:MAG: hypothetical protein IJQ73_03435 [Kiritimatiellae bacterium]|nr:hypothetical protein [Kiritimatiellia bacterium]
MKSAISITLVTLAAMTAGAVDLSKLADLDFAERYAFSTNRQAVIDTLHPKTQEWFAYSILNAQTEGRIDDANAWLKEWERNLHLPGSFDLWEMFRDRQMILCSDAGKGGGQNGKWDLRTVVMRHLSDRMRIPPREAEVKPNTYPSALDQSEITFESFWENANKHPDLLAPGMRFLAFRPENRKDAFNLDYYTKSDESPDAPFHFDLLLDYYSDGNLDHAFNGMGIDKLLTLPQLAAVAKKLAGTPKDVRGLAAFADIVLSKLVPGADDDPDDPILREDLLKRRYAFTKTLAPSLRDRHVKALRELLDFYRSRDDFAHADLFLEHLAAVRPGNGHVRCDDFVRDWIIALRQSGADAAAFAEYVEKRTLARLVAEADLLAGAPAAQIDAKLFSPQELKAIRERVELRWAGGNRPVFAADDDVALDIDVKGGARLRVAIYDLDPFAACCEAKGEVRADIDLDNAVPNVERFIEFEDVSPAVRHRERLDLPELKQPGLYVVECSANGVSSRAVIRKGRLRVTERRDSAGHVFTALDEKGVAVKGARLKVDDMVFEADENGEIAVPFAQTPERAVRKTAVIGAGRLASTIAFDHALESLEMRLVAVLSQESLVAGCEATALLRPVLKLSAVQAPLELLEKPSLSILFDDLHNRASVIEVRDFVPSSSEEGVVRFRVPQDLRRVRFRLVAYAKRATDGERVRLEATSAPLEANAIVRTDEIPQLFLRHASDGYVVECRGRAGERLPNRAFDFSFRHKVFSREVERKLQGDGNGEIHLGPLVDIAEVKCGKVAWKLGGDAFAGFPTSLSAAEGDALEIPARGLLQGEWPGARELGTRVSLLATNPEDAFTGDYIEACSYTNGVLRIAGLPAGDYRLALRAEGITVPIRVTKALGAVGDGGVIAGAVRALPDTGSVPPVRIASAKADGKGKLVVRLDNANGDTRLHIFARRTASDATDFPSAARLFASARIRPAASVGKWGGARSEYISGRDLGDKLRYILDRRQEAPRIGNMLDKPSLLLSPWSTTETGTGEVDMSDGEVWEESLAPDSAERGGIALKGAAFGSVANRAASRFTFDFLPGAEVVAVNLKPGKDGVLTVDLAPFKGMQDFRVVAFDGLSVDELRLTREAAPFEPRDLRLPADFDPFAAAGVEKRYSSVAGLYRLLASIDPEDKAFQEFGFVADWGGAKTDAEKRELYGRYACHELDLFLHEKDPKFFAEVVAPNLRNKRFKQFVDKWLLGEDLSAYAEPGRLQDLNAIEQCLLAMRVKKMVPVIARLLTDKCDAEGPDYEGDEQRLAIALDEMGAGLSDDADPPMYCIVDPSPASAPSGGPRAVEAASADILPVDALYDEAPQAQGMARAPRPAAAPMAEKSAAWSSQRALVGGMQNDMVMVGSLGPRSTADRRRAEMKRRNARQFYRPPERTKEWVESHYWRRRHAEDTSKLVGLSRFWRDLAVANADGKLDTFRSPNVIHAVYSFTEKMAALAFMRVDFEEGGDAVVFAREKIPEGDEDADIRVVQRFVDPETKDAEGNPVEVTDEFVAGRVYELETVRINPTSRSRRIGVYWQIPCGAVVLYGDLRAASGMCGVEPYDVTSRSVAFYFPVAGEDVGRLIPAVACERGVKRAEGAAFNCKVVAVPSKTDTTSWRYISQNGTDDEVLAFLSRENLTGLDLAKVGWRMNNAEYAEKVLKVLESRGAYCDALWLSGFEYDRFSKGVDEVRIRQALSRRENLKVLAPTLGPVFKSSLIEIEPERDDIFEHREYWPVINARTHSRGGAPTIPNEALAAEYRAFLDVLAAKRAPTPGDRLLAAVYLLAQDRVGEASALVAEVAPGDIETAMQRDYILAYLAFSAGRPADGRALAAKYVDKAVAPWDGRFREIVTQADEVAGGKVPENDAASAPTLSLRAEMAGGALDGVVVAARNLESCTVRAYPVDVEVGFSKNPFGNVSEGYANVVCLRPVWSAEIAFGGKPERRVAIPKELRKSNLVVTASGAGGSVEERIEAMPGSLDVQVSRAYRQIRVSGEGGRPIAGAYVKVYVRDAWGREVKFHKDGYTDLRGAFDYAAVSTDTDFRPAAYAILVQDGAHGAKVVRADP